MESQPKPLPPEFERARDVIRRALTVSASEILRREREVKAQRKTSQEKR
jgi:hypothetical protein